MQYLATPEASRHVRVDTGFAQGDEITPYYDSMIAKLIVWDESRDLALARLRGALDAYRIVGVANNLAFLQRLATAPAFVAADLDTALIERESAWLFPPAQEPPRDVWLAAAISVLLRAHTSADHSPWSAADGWRLGGRAEREVMLQAGDVSKTVGVQYHDGGWTLRIDDQLVSATAETALTLTVDGRRFAVTTVSSGEQIHVFMDGRRDVFVHVDPLAFTGATAAGPAGLRAPMPGRVIELIGTPGAEVTKGTALLVLEAMKIEHTILAPSHGTLRGFKVAVGEQVGEGTELVDFIATQSK